MLSPSTFRAGVSSGRCSVLHYGRNVRILHARSDLAGQQALLAQGQRSLGHDSVSYALPHPFGFEPPPDLRPRFENKFLRRLDVACFIASVPFRFEVIHFHGGSFLPPRLRAQDAMGYRRLGRTVIVQFWGSEARLDSVEAERNPYYPLPVPSTETHKRAMFDRWAEITGGHVIAADGAFDAFLTDHFDHIHVARQCVDTQALQPRYPRTEVESPLVVHAPSAPMLKGTPHVREAVETLRQEGVRFRYEELTGESHALVLEKVREADLVVDQLLLGSHGILAVESMALGKPVVCFILPELVPTYPEGFPMVNANPDSITDVLRAWIADGERRHAVGKASRAYAERVHDARVVAADTLDAYGRLPGARPRQAVNARP